MKNTLSAGRLDVLASMIDGQFTSVSFECATDLLEAGAISSDFGVGDYVTLSAWHLTPFGRQIAGARSLVNETRRRARNAAARGRADAMRSLGLVRTRSGGWE